MKSSTAETCPGKTEGKTETPKLYVAVEMLHTGKLLIKWGDHDFVFCVDHKGNPRVTRIDENTRWAISMGKDGDVVVKMLDDETGDIGL